jgi:hypothetical protein
MCTEVNSTTVTLTCAFFRLLCEVINESTNSTEIEMSRDGKWRVTQVEEPDEDDDDDDYDDYPIPAASPAPEDAAEPSVETGIEYYCLLFLVVFF